MNCSDGVSVIDDYLVKSFVSLESFVFQNMHEIEIQIFDSLRIGQKSASGYDYVVFWNCVCG